MAIRKKLNSILGKTITCRYLLFLCLGLMATNQCYADAANDAQIKRKIIAQCPKIDWDLGGPFSLSNLNPGTASYPGINLPGNYATLFRGIRPENPQFDDIKVLKSLLGVESLEIPSPMMWGIQMVFTGERGLNDPFLPIGQLPLPMIEYFKARNIDGEILALLDCHNNKAFSDVEINYLAKKLMDLSFRKMGRSDIITHFLNIKDPTYYNRGIQALGFGNNTVDMVISSYYDQVAAFYGNKILVFKDTSNRAVDLGYFNYKLNGVFWDMWIDNGEVNQPGYIAESDIQGFQQREKNRDPNNRGNYVPKNPIIFGLYKWKEGKEEYAILVAGTGKLCMLQDPKSQKIFYCDPNWASIATAPNAQDPLQPTPVPRISDYSAKNQAPIIGVFELCDKAQNCEGSKILEKYGTEISDIAAFQNNLKSPYVSQLVTNSSGAISNLKFSVNPKIPKVEMQDDPSLIGKIIVQSATFYPTSAAHLKQLVFGNATQKASSFLNGKAKMQYKVSARFLGISAQKDMGFEINWRCGGSNKVFTKDITSKAEDQVFEISCEN